VKRLHLWISAVALTLASCSGDSAGSAAPTMPTPAPGGPEPIRPLEGATITITAAGFSLDSRSAAAFKVGEIRVYQGAALTFFNGDSVPHDVLSDPIHMHTDCPEINAAGFLVPGQSRSTEPLNRLVTCGFHDHHHEGDQRFAGRVAVEPR
jgi:hypothetical protein